VEYSRDDHKSGEIATAISPRAEHHVIGAHPGEKLHKTMLSMAEAPFVARRGGILHRRAEVGDAGRWPNTPLTLPMHIRSRRRSNMSPVATLIG